MKVIPILLFSLLSSSIVANAAIDIPKNLLAPDNQTSVLNVDAKGVQIYICSPAKENPAKYEWSLKAPEAELVDVQGKHVGKHYAGPTWEINDGSKIVGELKAKADSPDPKAIPWFLLTAKSSTGSGLLSDIKSIQRISTEGGKAPQEECTKSEKDKEVRVSYKAVYIFYK